MGWNGSGSFSSIYNWEADKNAGIDITASRFDTQEADYTSNGFGNTLTRDGQGSATANLPMNTYRHTNVGNGVARSDYAALGQVQDSTVQWGGTSSGSAGAWTVTLVPAIAAYASGQKFRWIAGNDAAGNDTFNFNGLGAKNAYVCASSGVIQPTAGCWKAGQVLEGVYNSALNSNVGGIQISVSGAFGTQTLNGALNETSATLASAATVNIGAAAANYIFITGTTAITAFDTIQSGTERTLEFAGALTLTYNGTSLILPTGKNITTAAGDVATFRSEGSGNWRCTDYQRADGSALYTVLNNYRTDFLMSTAGSSATMTVGVGQAADSTNTVMINLKSSFSKTTGSWVAGTGNGGLDTGAIANNTGYHFYVIAKADGTTDVVFSTAAPPTGPALPSGYSYWRWVGWGVTDGSGHWAIFTQIGNVFYWGSYLTDFNSAAADTNAHLLTLNQNGTAPSVPSGINVFALGGVYLGGGASANGAVWVSSPAMPDVAPLNSATPTTPVVASAVSYNVGFTIFPGQFRLLTDTSARLRYRANTSTNTITITTHGWEIPANAAF